MTTLTTLQTLHGNTAGKLISIEGIDGVGKNTQAKILRDTLKDLHGVCGFFSFPRYETPTGQKVREYLNSLQDDLNIPQVAKLYADDRLAAREEILDYLLQGYPVVCDRYVTSNKAFQSIRAKLTQYAASSYPKGIIAYIDHLEFTQNFLPRPDLEIVLTASPEATQLMMSKRYEGDETKKDKHEGDLVLMKNTHEFYSEVLPFGHNDRRRKVDCTDEAGGVLAVQEISKRIYDVASFAGVI